MHRNFPEFRTPQHASLGTNRWGGSSPLLARNIPKEALQTRYLKLNSIRTRDEIFPAADDDIDCLDQPTPSKTLDPPPTPFRKFLKKISQHRKAEDIAHAPQTTTHRSFLSKFSLLRKKQKRLGSTHKKRSGWLPDGDYRNRWPQGWRW